MRSEYGFVIDRRTGNDETAGRTYQPVTPAPAFFCFAVYGQSTETTSV